VYDKGTNTYKAAVIPGISLTGDYEVFVTAEFVKNDNSEKASANSGGPLKATVMP
jgi:hypothetical protein